MNFRKKIREQIYTYTGGRRIARLICNTRENSGHLLTIIKTLQSTLNLLNKKKIVNKSVSLLELLDSMLCELKKGPDYYFSEEEKKENHIAPEGTFSCFQFYGQTDGRIILKLWLRKLNKLINTWSDQQLKITAVLDLVYSLTKLTDLQRKCFQNNIYISRRQLLHTLKQLNLIKSKVIKQKIIHIELRKMQAFHFKNKIPTIEFKKFIIKRKIEMKQLLEIVTQGEARILIILKQGEAHILIILKQGKIVESS